MKAQFSFFASTALLFATAWTSPGFPTNGSADVKPATVTEKQSNDFSFLRLHRQGKGVTASWGLSSNAGVVGFQLQKTYEDPTDPYAVWEDVSSLACNGSRSYKYTDNSVFPGFISYRIVALLGDGTTAQSGVSTVQIVSH